MERRTTAENTALFLAGFLAGAALVGTTALLWAPDPGGAARARMRARAAHVRLQVRRAGEAGLELLRHGSPLRKEQPPSVSGDPSEA